MSDQALIHTRFETLAARAPDALAVASDFGTLSYGELERLSRRLAARIDRSGAGPRDVVAILAERGPQIVIAALGCARAGRPFVIFDPAYPDARLASLAEVCRPSLLLLGDGPAWGGAALPTLPIADDEGPDLPWPRADISPDDPAYLLFTSGSTGAPKCVACSHRPLVNFVAWQARTFELTEADRFTMLSGLSHDPLLRDIFTPLSLGAAVHIPSQATLTQPGGLADWFARTRPTVAHMTPPLGHLLTATKARRERLDGLRYVFWGGDVLRRPLVEALAAIAPACESVNFYGATETPQAASFHRVPPGARHDRAPIGIGIDGFAVEVRDADGRAVRDGESGEIVVRSRFLTLGYVEDGRLPQPRLQPAELSYATGDLGRRLPNGEVAIDGRRDDQVKVRGYRVELAEITAAALRLRGVRQAITLNVGSLDDVRLCCFFEPARGRLDHQVLRRHFARALPAYMAPERIVDVPALPLLPNGKVDRQALIASVRSDARSVRPAATLGKTEAALADSWRDCFGGRDITAASSFATLGGDSLSYVTAYLSLEQQLGTVPDNWTTMTIAELAALADPAARKSRFVEIESAMLLRALAIAAVVGSHFQLFYSGGAGTSALLWVSGCIFGNLQLREMDASGGLTPIWRLLKSILLPLYLLELPQVLIKVATHYHPQLSSLFLTTDLIDYSGAPTSGPNAYLGHEYFLWYIHAVVHIVIAYAALMLLCRYGLKLRRPALAAAFAAVAIGLAGRFLAPALLVPHVWTTGVDPVSYFNHAPTTHLATFALAALSGLAAARWRIAILAATLAYAAVSAPIYGAADSLPIAAVAGVLFIAPKLKVPRFASTPIYLVAGASFFIYLLQFKFLLVFGHLHLPNTLAWPGAIAGGVAAWGAWNWTSRRIGALASRVRLQPPRLWRLGAQGV